MSNTLVLEIQFAVVLLSILSILSVIVGLIGLFLIRSINIWNGYTTLVFVLTLWQILYQFSFFFLVAAHYQYCFFLFRFIFVTFGVGVTLLTNYIVILVLYAVVYVKAVQIRTWLFFTFAVITAISLPLGIWAAIDSIYNPDDIAVDNLVLLVRLISVAVNALAFMTINALLYSPYKITCINWTLSDFALRRKTDELLLALSSRLQYYPLVQIFCLAGSLWWNIDFHFKADTIDYHADLSQNEVIALYMYVVTNPVGGIGFFFVYLYAQPSALQLLKQILANLSRCRYPMANTSTSRANNNNDNKIAGSNSSSEISYEDEDVYGGHNSSNKESSSSSNNMRSTSNVSHNSNRRSSTNPYDTSSLPAASLMRSTDEETGPAWMTRNSHTVVINPAARTHSIVEIIRLETDSMSQNNNNRNSTRRQESEIKDER